MSKYKVKEYSVVTEDGTEWIARYPDVNNCGGLGKTPEEAIKCAAENLAFELSLLKENSRKR